MAPPATRCACLLVPDLPRAATLRAHPELAGRCFAVAAGRGPRAEIVSVSEAAARHGVRAGHSVTQARCVCAELEIQIVSPALEETARAALLDAALSCSPRAVLEPRRAGAFAQEAAASIDASGVAALHHSESGFATALVTRAAALGLPARAAIASSRSIARIAARSIPPGAARSIPLGAARSSSPGDGEICVLAPGSEAAFLEPLAIDVLDPDDALAERLTRFGVHTLGDLLRLPHSALVTRLGPAAQALIEVARGRCALPALPVPVETRCVESIDLEHPVAQLEPLLFALQALLSRLLARLALRHLACDTLSLTLDLEGGGRDARQIGLAAPTLELRVLMRAVAQALEASPPRAALMRAQLETRGQPQRRDQLDLFRPAGPAPGALAPALAELASLCGASRVGAPAVADHHHPDTLAVQAFPGVASAAATPACGTPRLALRMLRPPLVAEVRVRAGYPTWIRSAIVRGRIVRCAGPWRTTGGWWSQQGRFAFDHFDVQLEDGGVARLRYDHLARVWQIDAIYD